MFKNEPLVSFIIPTYNSEKYIQNCLESILMQNYPTHLIEILVIDGCSSDNTINSIVNYPIKIFTNYKRIASEGRNIGIEKARGNILAFMDSDSELPQKNWLRLMIKPLSSDSKIAGSIPILIPKHNNPAISRFFSLIQADPIIVLAYGSGLDRQTDYISDENYFPMGLFVIKKEILTGQLKLKSTLERSEDVDVTYRLVKSGYKFALVHNAGLYHLFVDNFSNYLKKTYKRISIFVKSSSDCAFDYIPKNKIKHVFLKKLLYELSGVGIAIRLIKGIKKDNDFAWLYYPIVLLSTLFFYFIAFISDKKGRKLLEGFSK